MKLDYLIDTNIFISLFNDELDEPIPDGEIGYSIITEIEILSFSGLSREEEQLIRDTLSTLSRISLNATITNKTIQLRRKYRLKIPDAIVLASAWEHQAILLSNDRPLSRTEEVQVMSLKTVS